MLKVYTAARHILYSYYIHEYNKLYPNLSDGTYIDYYSKVLFLKKKKRLFQIPQRPTRVLKLEKFLDQS